MNLVKGLKYSKDHEWVKVEGDRAYIGITNFAQLELGDIVYLELPAPGDKFAESDVLGVIESVKTAADVLSPVSGTVVEVNEDLADSPEKVNEEPYESWFVVLELDDPSEIENLMEEEEYGRFCMEEGK